VRAAIGKGLLPTIHTPTRSLENVTHNKGTGYLELGANPGGCLQPALPWWRSKSRGRASIPAHRGKDVQPGMGARIEPSTAKREEFGTIKPLKRKLQLNNATVVRCHSVAVRLINDARLIWAGACRSRVEVGSWFYPQPVGSALVRDWRARRQGQGVLISLAKANGVVFVCRARARERLRLCPLFNGL
jgi:hypothetical protein